DYYCQVWDNSSKGLF
nr:immunoglobulin light chain junction region [Macaca mulatta]MOX78141.1 immunoglobulin light chain junction region [Macaca mulatta]MOX78946.1 immunoglobulin light chain junction region [Macaca mulatta]MOX80674.1 immunoglobulin light chain junction region [Macaca mulatta]MOX80942.1 immunoglobulin light chain junction region [Macaca mulatta]